MDWIVWLGIALVGWVIVSLLLAVGVARILGGHRTNPLSDA